MTAGASKDHMAIGGIVGYSCWSFRIAGVVRRNLRVGQVWRGRLGTAGLLPGMFASGWCRSSVIGWLPVPQWVMICPHNGSDRG